MQKILIVEDETLVAMEIASALKKEGYTVTDTVESAKQALNSIKENEPHLILMDININGDINGIETARSIKTLYDIPIIFLTAYNDKETIDKAIQTAPIAYLIKPFKRQELYASVSLGLLNAVKSSPKQIHISDGCIYDFDTSEIFVNKEPISLTKREKKLFDLLIDHRNKLVSFSTIELELWPDKSVSTTTRRTLIYRLREKIGSDNIKTVKDFGCILEV